MLSDNSDVRVCGRGVPVRIQSLERRDVLSASPVCVATPSPPVCVLRLSIATPSKSSHLALVPRSSLIVSKLASYNCCEGNTSSRRPRQNAGVASSSTHTQEITGCVRIDRQRET